jgi:hypothetical protein
MARLTARALRNLGHGMSSQTSQLLSWADDDAGSSGAPTPLDRRGSGGLVSPRPLSRAPSAAAGAPERPWAEPGRGGRRWALDYGGGEARRGPEGLAPEPFQGSSFWASALAWFDSDWADEAGAGEPGRTGDVELGRQGGAAGGRPDGERRRQEQQRERWQQRAQRYLKGWRAEGGGGGAAAAPAAAGTAATATGDTGSAQLGVEAPPAAQPASHSNGRPLFASPFAKLSAAAAAVPPEAAQQHQQQQQQQQQAEQQAEQQPERHSIEQQRSLLFDEAPPEVYRERMRRSTFSFLINQQDGGSSIGGVRQRRRGAASGSASNDASFVGRRGRSAVSDADRIETIGERPAAQAAAGASSSTSSIAAAARPGVGGGVNSRVDSLTEDGWEEFFVPLSAAAQAPLVRDILPLLARARALLPSARAEPAWLVAGGGAAAGARAGQAAWEELLDAAERLAMR